MIKITKRQKAILHVLLENDVFITVKNLSERFDVSSRTLRYDLDLIEYFLKEQGVRLERKPHFGVRIQFKESECKAIIKNLNQNDDYQLPQEERRRLVLFYLLYESLLTIEHLADLLEVSKQTIQSDLEVLDTTLDQTSLKIVRKVRLGCHVEGDEIELRRYFTKLYTGMNASERTIIDQYVKAKCIKIEEKACRIVRNMENFQKFNFAHPVELCSIIAFNLYRSSKGFLLPNDYAHQFEAGRLSLVEKLTNNFEMNIHENDAMFILEHMLNAKVDSTPQTWIEQDEDEIIASELADFLLNGLTVVTKLSEKESTTFIENLQLHLKITLFRIRNKLNVENQILDRVKVSSPLIYEYTKSRLMEYEAKSGLYFNEEEIAYIAMHVGAIVEKRALYAPGLNVLVACHFGIATSKIMVSRLAAMIPEINIIGPVRLDEVSKYVANQTIDLIITTLKFDSNIEIVQVSPLLSDEDVYRIKTKRSEERRVG